MKSLIHFVSCPFFASERLFLLQNFCSFFFLNFFFAEISQFLKFKLIQIGESCLNAHHLVVSYENVSELNETASAVIQCSGLGILKPNTIIIDFPKSGSSSSNLLATFLFHTSKVTD